jgi:folate-binding protein YgfZ
MPTVHLSDRSLIHVSGTEAEHFLQNLITVDLGQLGPGEVRPSALLSPQGKVMFDFLISRSGDGFAIDIATALAADFSRRLMLYRLRAKVEISQPAESLVATSWSGDSGSEPAGSGSLVDRRFPQGADVYRAYQDVPTADADLAAWHLLRIAHGVAESGSDFAAGDAFPHDILYDFNGGIGFRKGCFVGQEVVSRMQHRGTARRRVVGVEAGSPLPAPGTAVEAGGRPIGTLGTVEGRQGLAIIRIDRAGDALDSGTPILAGDAELALSIPAWAGFTFPEGGAPADEA